MELFPLLSSVCFQELSLYLSFLSYLLWPFLVPSSLSPFFVAQNFIVWSVSLFVSASQPKNRFCAISFLYITTPLPSATLLLKHLSNHLSSCIPIFLPTVYQVYRSIHLSMSNSLSAVFFCADPAASVVSVSFSPHCPQLGRNAIGLVNTPGHDQNTRVES